MIVLFDLDGTVLRPDDTSPGPGRTSMERAIHAMFDVRGVTEGIRFAGATDRVIARLLLAKVGLGPQEIEANVVPFLDRYVGFLDEELGRRRYRTIGDVAATTELLVARGACVGLGTGNIRRGAHLKLRSAGLDGCFDLARGGFGCDADTRPDVLRAGVARCVPHACVDAKVVVVGDTRHDVTAARAIGAFVVGVAIDDAARAELVEAGADTIVADAGPAVVEAIDRAARQIS